MRLATVGLEADAAADVLIAFADGELAPVWLLSLPWLLVVAVAALVWPADALQPTSSDAPVAEPASWRNARRLRAIC